VRNQWNQQAQKSFRGLSGSSECAIVSSLQDTRSMGEVSASQSSKLNAEQENYGTVVAVSTTDGDGQSIIPQEVVQQISESISSTSTGEIAQTLQPLVPITDQSQGKEDYPKCFVHIQPCYPFGIANVDEKMLVVTPDDDISLYEDAVVSTPRIFLFLM
jgi:hypothetical protein